MIALTPYIALGQQPPSYSGAQNFKENQIIKFVEELSNISSIQRVLSLVDLNDDGIYEYIVKPLNCNKNMMCPHHVVAFKSREPILLLYIEAFRITPSDKRTYGISDLIIHNQMHNDFLSKNFGWNPFSYRYEQKEF